MPAPLKPRERQLLLILSQHAGADRTQHYITLREAKVPEEVTAIYGSKAEFLDSLMHREMKLLETKGWIELKNSVYRVLHEPT